MTEQIQPASVPEFQLQDRMHVSMRAAGIGVQEMADYLGVTRQTVGTWTNGRITPGKQTLRLWALRTGVPLEWLEGPERARRDSNPKPSDLYLRLAPVAFAVKPRLTVQPLSGVPAVRHLRAVS